MDGVTSVTNGGLVLRQSRDEKHDGRLLNEVEVLVQWFVASSLDLDEFGQTMLGEVCVCVGALG